MFRVPKSLIQQLDTSKWNATSLEARDIKLKITKIDILSGKTSRKVVVLCTLSVVL